MKTYILKDGEVKEVKQKLNLKPAKIYKENDCYYGVGEVSKKFLSIMARALKIEAIRKERNGK